MFLCPSGKEFDYVNKKKEKNHPIQEGEFSFLKQEQLLDH